MFVPLRRYFDFNGRSRRKEAWSFIAFTLIVYGLCLVPHFLLFEDGDEGMHIASQIALGAAMLGFAIPHLALQVRREHDRGRSGWFVLLIFLPYIGALIALINLLWPGQRGENRYGPDPRIRYVPDAKATQAPRYRPGYSQRF